MMSARIRIERKIRRPARGDRSAILPLDPRDPDIVRVKRTERQVRQRF